MNTVMASRDSLGASSVDVGVEAVTKALPLKGTSGLDHFDGRPSQQPSTADTIEFDRVLQSDVFDTLSVYLSRNMLILISDRNQHTVNTS